MNKIKNYMMGFQHYKALLYELVARDIKVRYKRSFLGLLWTIINPILTMAVMTVVFSKLFRFQIENYTTYFLVGNILFTFFTEATTNSMHSVLDSSNLIKKVYVPKYLFPVSKVMSSVVNLFFSFFALVIVMVATRVPFKATMWLSPIVLGYIIMFATGIGLILAAIMVFFRDIAQLYSIITLLWMYLTPIFYPVELLQENIPWVLTINPIFHYIDFFRKLVLDGTIPSVRENMLCLAVSVVTLLIGLFVFYRKQDKYILYI